MNMDVSLTDELEEFVKAKVSSGRYASASEVVREALHLMEQREKTVEARLDYLREAYAEGKVSGDAGEMDFTTIKAEGRALLAKISK